MAAVDGTYRIFRRPASNDPGVGFTDSGESHTGSIGNAFSFAQTLQDADAANVYIPLVGYDVLTDGAAPNPVLNDAGAPVPVVNNRISAVWEQCTPVNDYLAATYGNQVWALQSYGPG